MTDAELDVLLQELMTWEHDLSPLRTQWDAYWSRWELEPPKAADNPFMSKFVAPYPFSHVETILPRVVGSDPAISYQAIDNEEDDPAAQMLSAVVAWQMALMLFEHEVRPFIRQGLVLGYTVGKLGWIRESHIETIKVVREAVDEETLHSYQVEDDEDIEWVTRNQAFFETVDVYDFVWPLRAASIDKAKAVWQRSWVTLEHMKEMAADGHYKNVGKIKPGSTADRINILQERFAAQGLHPSMDISFDDDRAEIELWERWEDDRLTVIANREIVVRDQGNPFTHKRKPFMDWCPVERPFAFQGVGIPKMIWDMNEDLSALKRQRRDSVSLNINPMYKATEGIDDDDIVIAPGSIIHVPDTDDIQPMNIPQVDIGASYQEESQAKDDMQIVSGAYDYFSGLNPGGDQTATGVSTITNEANKRVAEMIKVFSERTMKRFGMQIAHLCIQHLDESVAIPIWKYPDAQRAWHELKGEAPARIVKVGAEDISTAGRVLPLPEVGQDKSVNDVQKRSDAVQVVQTLAPILASPTPVVDPKAFTEYILKQFGVPLADRDKILDTQNAVPGAIQPTSDGGQNAPTGNVVGLPGVAGPTAPSVGTGQ